jgi:phage FluMu gp28-like protein
MNFSSSRQLQDMMRKYLRRGVDCIYLCHSIRECRYMIELMLEIFEPEEMNIDHYWIRFKNAKVFFKSVTSPPHTLNGYRGVIIPDHSAFRENPRDVPDFRERIKRSVQRYGYDENNQQIRD